MRHAVASLAGYALRMRGYLGDLFPLPAHIAFALLAASGIAGFTRTVHGVSAALSLGLVTGIAWNVFAMLLILRLMDELKDRDIDRRLFPERPLPSGRVRESDIRWSLGAMIVLYLLANLHSPMPFVLAMVVVGYAMLMFKRFFIAVILENSLPLTLATHTPVVPLIWLQAFATAAGSFGIPLSGLRWQPIGLYVAMLWLGVLGWELSRKIRSAEEENDYVTYSRILGPMRAVAVAAGTQAVAMLIGALLYFRFAPGAPYLMVMGAGGAACCWGYVRFLANPNPRTSRLKPFAATFLFALLLAQLYGFVLARP